MDKSVLPVLSSVPVCRVMAAFAVLLAVLAGRPAAAADPVYILFVGNSYTHGRYDPALNYNAGAASNPSNSVVHDLNCPGTGTICTSGVEDVAPVVPTTSNTPGGTLAGQLDYLNSNPSAQYTEVGPFGGVAGIFLQLTEEAGLNYNVSLIAVSSATLTGYANNTGSEAGDLPRIENSKYSQVVLQDQSFQPLPTTVTVNGQSVATRGDPTSFQSGVTRLANDIDAADASGHTVPASITLFETPPIAAFGDADPIAAMASDLHNAYLEAASAYDAANPTKSHISVALAGDAWVTAIDMGIAQQNPFLVNESAGQVDLWDSDPLLACCETPIGYHPSVYGDYLDALVLFYQITGLNAAAIDAEFDPSNPSYDNSASVALGISAPIARELAVAAAETLQDGGPVPLTNLPPTAGQSCYGTFNGTFSGDVTVSPGQNCMFTEICEITGNVTVNGGSFILACAVDGNVTENGGSLVLGPSASVGGNVQISGASAFTLGPGAAIGGNLQIQQLPAGKPQEAVCGTQIKGNLQVQNNGSPIDIGANNANTCAGDAVGGNLQVNNNSAAVQIDDNTVSGNLQVNNDSATTDVSGNLVAKNLQCQNNSVVTDVALNMVQGQAQGQCAAFPQ